MTDARRDLCSGLRNLAAASVAFMMTTFAVAQDFDRVAPKPVEPTGEGAIVETEAPQAVGDQRVVLERLLGVVFLASPDDVQREGVEAFEGVRVEAVPLLQDKKFEPLITPYLGKPATLQSLSQLTRDVVLYCRRHDRPVVDVFVPEQDVTSGVVQVVVLEGKLGQLRVTGNEHFADELLLSKVRVQPGETFSAAQLRGDVDWLNLNPFRRVDVVFIPGAEPGQTDVELRVDDRVPFRIYAGYENTGTPFTDEDRLVAGFNWGNVLGLDHQLGYQFTSSPEPEEFSAHALTYLAPLPWRHALSVFASYAETEGEIGAPFDMTGRSWQLGLRYAVPLDSCSERFDHELRFGFDFKQSNNNLLFGGDQVFDTTTDIAQFIVGYDATLTDDWGATSAGASLFLSPGGITGRNRKSNFEDARVNADPEYVYARFHVERTTRLPADFTWLIRAQAQVASDNLLPSEQLGLGGFDTIRGYTEREANGDEGFWLSTELRTPPLQPAKMLGLDAPDSLQLLTFFDYGIVSPHDALTGEDEHVVLASAGVGLRYALSHILSVRYDYGWQLKDSGLSPEGRNGQHHLAIVASFNF